MKSKIIIVILIPILLGGCSSQLCLQKKTNKLIKELHEEADTVYLYSSAFNNFNLMWNHKNNFIYCFEVKPYRTKKNKPIEAKNISINKDSVNKYFNNFILKDIPCFESVLDGAWIKLLIKNRESLFSNIDTDCLFRNKYSVNSFPYKLRYDLSKIWKLK